MSNELKKEMLGDVKNEVNKTIELQVESEQEAVALSFVNDDQKADDVLFWHKHYTNKVKELKEFRNDEIGRIEMFCDRKIKYVKQRLSFLENALESYLMANDNKSTTLTNGRFGTRKNPDKVIIADKDKYIEYCKQNNLINHLCKISYNAKAKELKEHIITTGETPEGAEYVEGQLNFYVKTHE